MSTEWAIIRGSGIAAFALLSASVIWGLLVSSKLIPRHVRAKPLTWFHESLGIGALLATLIHVVVISVHEYLDFGWAEILVPGRSDWRPLPTAFGTLAMYGLVVVVVSFYVRKWIGQSMWRVIHFGAFGVFLSSLVHGIQAGSDSTSLLVMGLYAGSAIVVFGLVAHRLTAIEVEPPEPANQPRASTNPVRTEARSRSRAARS
ncbi:MAG TPA: ferric reductase-like transmembrane domain-containing protein [Acidimicrobiia bacterium]|nr:ferric reductase-like transmembrane domain-containing protein [Acidimicrobiia bacterium]